MAPSILESSMTDAKAIKELVSECVEDGMHRARRTVAEGIRSAEDLRDTAVHQVRRNPLAALGAAFGIGVMLGTFVGWAGRRRRT